MLLAFLPLGILDRVDICELNHIYSPESGQLQGSYWVWWELLDGEYRVRDWRRMVDVPEPVCGIQYWYDVKTKRQRWVESRLQVITRTYYDRESFDRQFLPESKRRKLNGH